VQIIYGLFNIMYGFNSEEFESYTYKGVYRFFVLILHLLLGTHPV